MSLRGYDAWVTREPYWPEPPCQSRCSRCGCWLKMQPNLTETKEATDTCTGVVVVERIYTEADAGTLDIIGWDFLGRTYHDSYEPACGLGECCPAEMGEANAHTFVAWAWSELHRVCGHCGHDNIDVD